MNELNNPAARLHAFLKKGQSEKHDTQAARIWAKLLNTSDKNVPLLLRRIGYIMALPAQIEGQIRSISDINHDIHLRWLSRANAAVSITSFNAAWKTFIGRFDAEVIYGIEVCADALSRSHPEKTLSASQLTDLIEQLNALESEFSQQQFPPSIGAFIQDRFLEIRMALEEVPYRGVVPLETAIETSIGKTVINPAIYHESKNTPFGKRFWEYMGYLAISVTITTGAIQIGKEVVNLLPSSAEVVEEESSESNKGVEETKPNETPSNIKTIET